MPEICENSGRLTGAAGAGRGRGVERLVHDLADGARATAALGAAAETSIDLPGRARTRLRRDGGADIVVGQDVAGTDDHRTNMVPGRHFDTVPRRPRQKKSAVFTGCLNCKTRAFPGASRNFHSARRRPTPQRRPAPRQCRRPHPRPASCRRPRPSPGSPARCRTGGSPAGPGR